MANTVEQIVDQISKMSVLDVSKLVKAIEETFGVSASAVAAAPTAAVAAPAAEQAKGEEKAEYKVTLVNGGSDKIKAIKAVRSVTTLALTEAKKAVEEAPFVLAESASKDDAMKMKKALEEAGAKVELS